MLYIINIVFKRLAYIDVETIGIFFVGWTFLFRSCKTVNTVSVFIPQNLEGLDRFCDGMFLGGGGNCLMGWFTID